MSRIAVIGAPPRVDGWALAGAVVVPVDKADETERAWDELPADVEVVVMTADVAERLGSRALRRLAVVLP